MKVLLPLRTYVPSSRRAEVSMDTASLPTAGSERQKAPIFSALRREGRYFSFCSWLAKLWMFWMAREVWAM